MSDSNAQEPTMEEILASIRRIISEDDAPAAAASADAADAPVEAAAPEAYEPDDEDVLDLTEPAPPPPAPVAPAPAPAPVYAQPAASNHSLGDLDISFPPGPAAPPPPRPAPAPAYRPAPAPVSSYAADDDEPLMSDPSMDRAASFFGALGRNAPMPAEGRTLEHLVAELLRPVLKDWLDQHLPSIVEAKVQAEVERVSRRR